VLARRRADPDPGVVDQHVQAPEAVAVPADHLDDALLVGHVGGDRLDLVALGAQRLGGLLERVGLAGRDRERVALLGQQLGDGEADAPGGTGDEGSAIGHGGGPYVTAGSRRGAGARNVNSCGSRCRVAAAYSRW
jgi:hypothetical protein